MERRSCSRHSCRSRDRGLRDVEYDEVEEVLSSKPIDKDHYYKRKIKRSRSEDRERKKDHHCRDKSKDLHAKHNKDNSECDDEIHIKQEPVDAYDNYNNEYDSYNSFHNDYDPDEVKKEEPDEENSNCGCYSDNMI